MGWARSLAPGQVSRIRVVDPSTGSPRTVHVDHGVLFEAPNWSSGGELVLNGDGVLWSMPSDGSAPPRRIAIADLPELNNDHVLARDGESIFLSANDGNIYLAPLAGGAARRVTHGPDGRFHFLHGVSPDGGRLAYVAVRLDDGWQNAVVRTVAADGSDDRTVTVPPGPDDGPEYSSDGEWIYFNTERFSEAPGHAQIARMRPDGTGIEQLTFDARVNWFPHLEPAGRRAVYLSFPTGTEGHPADLPVRLVIVGTDDWTAPVHAIELFGGQGTINVDSWNPDGGAFAYVDYPQAADIDEEES
ncbi:hypothetical protein GCM10009775_16220 [Microbacterium aoyamense]|uniref:Biopolymer transporter Tol n=1 Tax=Microbacterium aoyamense TaxID=344166 RepID=A0ABN2PMV3_9MICO|nr:biopolymer transporter Tol [Microbacterium aoyamense]